MFQKTKLHDGLQQDCKVCTPDRKVKKVYDREPKVERRAHDTRTAVKRQIAEETGESELTKDQNFALLQKFGMVSPRIDRKVTKPSWMSLKEFNQRLNEWYRETKNLVPAVQEKRKEWKPNKNTTVAGTSLTKRRLSNETNFGGKRTQINSERRAEGRSVRNAG